MYLTIKTIYKKDFELGKQIEYFCEDNNIKLAGDDNLLCSAFNEVINYFNLRKWAKDNYIKR